MKKAGILLTALCLCLSLYGCTKQIEGTQTLTGRGLVFESGSCAILTENNEVIVLTDCSADGNLLTCLHTGDRIEITNGPIRETYPAQTDLYALKILERGRADSIPPESLENLKELGWKLAEETTKENVTEQILSAVTEPYSGEIPSIVPGDSMPETYFHRNGDSVEPLENPNRITVISEFREQMGDTPIPVSDRQVTAIVQQINMLQLEGYDPDQSQFIRPAGGGYLVRLYYGEQVVTFNFGTDWMISARFPDDAQERWFLDKSGNFNALIQRLYPVLLQSG